VSDDQHLPADMLLVRERQRRLRGAGALEMPEHLAPAGDHEDVVSFDEDLLIDEVASPPSIAPASGDVVLRRPISTISFAQVAWSGPIDHHALQSALACNPVRPDDVARFPALFQHLGPLVQAGAPALGIVLSTDDVALLAQEVSAREDSPLILAARLPEHLDTADPATDAVVSRVLSAYRHASLSCAWQTHFGASDVAQMQREREEAAVAVLSTLRALIGER